MSRKWLAALLIPGIIAVASPAFAEGDDGPTVTDSSIVVANPQVQRVVDYALSKIGHRYVAGGRGPDVFDCSGFTSAAYAQIGIDLPAYSFTQARMGWGVSQGDIQAGDLLFMPGGHAGDIRAFGHVALAISPTEMVSASNPHDGVHRVRIPANLNGIRRYVG
jgi:cell wall-associated NlpC family hydrolase